MTDFINQLPEEVYAMADDISLSDLLIFEATRHWTVSLISNASVNQEKLPNEMEDEERLLMHNVLTINQMLPHDMRMASFSKCSNLVQQNRQNKRPHSNGE